MVERPKHLFRCVGREVIDTMDINAWDMPGGVRDTGESQDCTDTSIHLGAVSLYCSVYTQVCGINAMLYRFPDLCDLVDDKFALIVAV